MIRAPHATDRIRITFKEVRIASGDYIYIHDGSSLSATRVGSHNGYTLPNQYLSTGGTLLIRFVSNELYEDSGFDIFYDTGKNNASCNLRMYSLRT